MAGAWLNTDCLASGQMKTLIELGDPVILGLYWASFGRFSHPGIHIWWRGSYIIGNKDR
jgi:hypothetical protein